MALLWDTVGSAAAQHCWAKTLKIVETPTGRQPVRSRTKPWPVEIRELLLEPFLSRGRAAPFWSAVVIWRANNIQESLVSVYVNGCLVWYADGWWGLYMKAGEWHETVWQPELICSAHRVIDAEIVYTHSQFFSPCVRLHFCMHFCVCSRTPCSSSIWTYVCLCAHTCVYLCVSVCVCAYISAQPQPRFLTLRLWLSAPWLLICSPSCLPRSTISPSISLRVSRS